MWPQRVFATWWLTLSLIIEVLYLLVNLPLCRGPADISGPGAHFSVTTSPMCAALSKVQDVLNLIFTGPGSAIFLGHPSTNSVWSSAVIQQPQNRRQRFSWERPKRSKMSHQKVPARLRVAVWAFPESSSSHGAHSAVGHWHALKWLGWSPGITVCCRPPPSGASSLPAEEGAVARWPQPAPASGARPGPEVCSAVASAPLLPPCVCRQHLHKQLKQLCRRWVWRDHHDASRAINHTSATICYPCNGLDW